MLKIPLAGDFVGASDSDFVIAEWTQDGPEWVAPLHYHRNCDEAWYVLEGVLSFLVGEDETLVPAGSAILVPKGTVHSYRNAGEVPARYLLVMTSKTHQLIDAIHSSSDRSPEGMAAVFERFDAVLLGWPRQTKV
ncbi:cupin domain-containing protein [Fimbriimonas ginsengisoli]|uniref:Cupin n=1 Tax=Fimbriimonas ginsengisoli Gsoil 348 TaxID=661478 RepID=A0A068NM49_FIMGI|nr:cupin domain-containing protein [Fimbriimonas ginsengisoli]AIE84497.1 cupin [Fimbriimonas ginsengisoli Gsoil 348]